jgi:hypothetical protein
MKKNHWLALIVAPLILLAVFGLFVREMYPIYLNSPFFGQDPAYQYLFAGADILQGHSPKHTDHPGTPVQAIIAAVIFIVGSLGDLLGSSDHGLFKSVLSHPETYLMATGILLGLLTASATYFLGYRVYQSTKSLLLATSAQLTPLLFSLTAAYSVYPTPEAGLGCLALLLIGVLTPNLIDPDEARKTAQTQRALWAGICCGLGLAIKITFIPMLGLLLVLRSPRFIILAVVALIVAWLVGVSAIFSRLPVMFNWFYQVLTHSGLHGQGANDDFNLLAILKSFDQLWVMFPLLYTAAGALCLAILLLVGVCIAKYFHLLFSGVDEAMYSKASDLLNRLVSPVTLLLVVLVQTIMVAKHVGPTYMIPALSLTVMIAIWLVATQNQIVKNKLLTLVLSGALLAFVSSQAWFSSVGAIKLVESNHHRGQIAHEEIAAGVSQYDEPILIGTFNCNLQLCATWFGLLLVPEMDLLMNKIDQSFYHFDIFSRALHAPGVGELTREQTAKKINELVNSGRPVVLVSPPFEQLSSFKLEEIARTDIQILYKVVGFDENSK